MRGSLSAMMSRSSYSAASSAHASFSNSSANSPAPGSVKSTWLQSPPSWRMTRHVEIKHRFRLPEPLWIDAELRRLQFRRKERAAKIQHARERGRAAAMHAEHDERRFARADGPRAATARRAHRRGRVHRPPLRRQRPQHGHRDERALSAAQADASAAAFDSRGHRGPSSLRPPGSADSAFARNSPNTRSASALTRSPASAIVFCA